MPIGWLAAFWTMRPLGFASLGSCRLTVHASACLALRLALLPTHVLSSERRMAAAAAVVIRSLLLLLLCFLRLLDDSC